MRKCGQITGKLLRWTHISILIHFNSIHHAGGFVKGVSGFFSKKGKLPPWDFITFREVLSGVIKAPETLENTPIYPCEGVIGCYRTLPHFYGLADAREGKIKGKTQGTTREWSGKKNCRDVYQAPPEPPLCEAGQLKIVALVSRWIDGH